MIRFSAGHGEFSDYCLESTAKVLATKFPCHDVWVVLPKNHVHGVLASYDNFVKTDWASGGAVLECEWYSMADYTHSGLLFAI